MSLVGFNNKRVPKKHGNFQDWFECIDHYMELYGCEWKWTETSITLIASKEYIIPFEGHENGVWDITKAGELLIEAIKKNKIKKVKRTKKNSKI